MDNTVTAGITDAGALARTFETLHCLNPPFCSIDDGHLVKVDIVVNTRSTFVFDVSENCGTNPTTYDIGKTLIHEFYHMLSSEHSTEDDSIVVEEYACGTGDIPTEDDSVYMIRKYPKEVP